jgi:hypothetical protein
LHAWQLRTPYSAAEAFVFPSLSKHGAVPLYASTFVADYLGPAAKKAGVKIAACQRFSLHNLRHSRSNWRVNTGRVQPKTVYGLLRHSKIQTTLDLYTQSDGDETRVAQGEFLNAVGLKESAMMWVEKRRGPATKMEMPLKSVAFGRFQMATARVLSLPIPLPDFGPASKSAIKCCIRSALTQAEAAIAIATSLDR